MCPTKVLLKYLTYPQQPLFEGEITQTFVKSPLDYANIECIIHFKYELCRWEEGMF